MIRVYLLAPYLIAATLVACRAAPPPTRAELLQRLHQCRDELSKERPSGRFVSPCAKLDPSSLNGISRTELAASLGPPTFCLGLSAGGPPHGPDCPPQFDPRWSFHLIGGDGPELFCETDEKQRCEEVSWIRSSD
jgi:hypothetical protein